MLSEFQRSPFFSYLWLRVITAEEAGFNLHIVYSRRGLEGGGGGGKPYSADNHTVITSPSHPNKKMEEPQTAVSPLLGLSSMAY